MLTPLPGHRLNRRPQQVCLDRSTCRDLRSLDHVNAPVQHGQEDLVLRATVEGDTAKGLLGILAEKLEERPAALGRYTEFCFHIIVVISDLAHVCCPVLCHVDFCNRSSRLVDDFSHQILVQADRAPEHSTAHRTSIMAERVPGATTSNTPGPAISSKTAVYINAFCKEKCFEIRSIHDMVRWPTLGFPLMAS